jgi:predicted RNA binding protein YcfA (HicA-like mRNA interferase family)
MPKRYSSDEVIRVLLSHGFVKASQRGSHVKLTRVGYVVIVPSGRKDLCTGTFASILRQSGLSASDFSGA